MRNFSKVAKILLAVLAVIFVASVVVLIMNITAHGNITMPIVALIGSVAGFGFTFKTAVTERDEKLATEKSDSEESDEDESDDEE